MIRLLVVVSFFMLSSAQRKIRDFGYDYCDGSYVGDGFYNLAGETSYNRKVELVCDFSKSRIYDRVTNIDWIRLDDYGSCRQAEPIRGVLSVITRYGRSTLTISDYSSRDHGVYRCFGTVDSGRYKDVVYMDVAFKPKSGYRYSRHLY